MKKEYALYLILAGIVLNGLDLVTSKAGTGGVVFGSTGFLTGINNKLPQVNVPTTSIPINLGGWLVIIGAVIYLFQRYAK